MTFVTGKLTVRDLKVTASCSRLSFSSTTLANKGEHLLVVPAEVLGWMLFGPAWSCAHLWVYASGQGCLPLIGQTGVTWLFLELGVELVPQKPHGMRMGRMISPKEYRSADTRRRGDECQAGKTSAVLFSIHGLVWLSPNEATDSGTPLNCVRVIEPFENIMKLMGLLPRKTKLELPGMASEVPVSPVCLLPAKVPSQPHWPLRCSLLTMLLPPTGLDLIVPSDLVNTSCLYSLIAPWTSFLSLCQCGSCNFFLYGYLVNICLSHESRGSMEEGAGSAFLHVCSAQQCLACSLCSVVRDECLPFSTYFSLNFLVAYTSVESVSGPQVKNLRIKNGKIKALDSQLS